MATDERAEPSLGQKLTAELIGTFFATLVPTAVDVVFYQGGSGVDYVSRWLARGFVTIAMIYTFSEVSGAHINPAVSLGFMIRGVMPVRLMGAYWIAQLAGGFAAAGLLYAVWGPAVAVGASHPGTGISDPLAAGCEVVLTFLVMIVILGTAEQESSVGKQAAIAVGLTVAACGFFGGPISGASMNPARSIPPQLLGGLDGICWIYLAGPAIGSTLAALAAFTAFGPPAHGERKAAGEPSAAAS